MEQEVRQGDRVQFTRNNYRAERNNGETAEVVAIDPTGSNMVVDREDGRGLLLSTDSVTAIQGAVGTAKTTTVLATFADAARDRDFEVTALALTATAVDVLARAIDAEPMTVARMLAGTPDPCKKPKMSMVDDASMLGARDAEALLALAKAEGTRLVLVGDVDQLGSVEAGRAFGQFAGRRHDDVRP